MLSVTFYLLVYIEFHHAEWCFAERRYAEFGFAMCHDA